MLNLTAMAAMMVCISLLLYIKSSLWRRQWIGYIYSFHISTTMHNRHCQYQFFHLYADSANRNRDFLNNVSGEFLSDEVLKYFSP
jgi:hypothetical protein